MDKTIESRGKPHAGLDIILLLVVFAAAAGLHFYNLGQFGFWGDELYHVFAAQSVIENGTPAFPGGEEYRRALPFTYLVAAAFKLLGVSEFSARLPSVLFSLAFLAASSFMVRRLFDGYSAVVYAVIIGLSPFTLHIARQCRMYSAFQLFYVLSLFAFFQALIRFETLWQYGHVLRSVTAGIRDRRVWAFLVLGAMSWGLAFILQPLALNAVPAMLSFIAGMLGWRWIAQGPRIALQSVYALALLAAATAFLVALAAFPQVIRELGALALAMPKWATFLKDQMGSTYYRYFLADNYPTLLFLYPIAAVATVWRRPAFGLLCLSAFVPLLLLHSYVFPLKQQRYLYYLFPFFALPPAVLFRQCVADMWAQLRDRLPAGFRPAKPLAAIALAFAAYLFFFPWLGKARNEVSRWSWSGDWKQIVHHYKPLIDGRKPTVVTTSQNHFYYYFGRPPDYYLRASYRPGDYDAEYYLGSETIFTSDQLRQVLDRHPDAIVITEYNLSNRDYYTPEMARLIAERYVNDSQALSNRIEVYLPKMPPPPISPGA